MIAVTLAASRTTSERVTRLSYDARLLGYTLTAGYENQGGFWLARADSLNSMARWLPDLDAVEAALEEVGQ